MASGSGGVDRRKFLQSSMLLGGVAPLCCTTPVAPPGSFRFEGATLVLDLGQYPISARLGPRAPWWMRAAR